MSKRKHKHKSALKEMIWHSVERACDERLESFLASSQLLHLTKPTDETLDQLRAVEAICREIKAQLSRIDLKSDYKTDLDVLSHAAPLWMLLREGEAAAP